MLWVSFSRRYFISQKRRNSVFRYGYRNRYPTLNSTPTLSRRCRHSAFGIRHSALGNSAVFSFPRSKNTSSPHVSIWNTISRDRNVRIAPNVSPFLTGGGGRGSRGRKEGNDFGIFGVFPKKKGGIDRYIDILLLNNYLFIRRCPPRSSSSCACHDYIYIHIHNSAGEYNIYQGSSPTRSTASPSTIS